MSDISGSSKEGHRIKCKQTQPEGCTNSQSERDLAKLSVEDNLI
jgi:hypothetical protein